MGPPLEPQETAADVSPPNLGDVPPHYQVKFETSKGDVVIAVHSHWSPYGAARFHELVKSGFFDDCRFFRVVPGFVVQWGINGDPDVMKKWSHANIPDDRPTGENRKPNRRGTLTFANAGPNSRSTQLFINYKDNTDLDRPDRGFTPFGEVIEGLKIVDSFNSKYGETITDKQDRIEHEGNTFLDKTYPGLDFIKKATFVEQSAEPSETNSKDAPETKSDGGDNPKDAKTPAKEPVPE